jgi:arylsulfatase
MNKALPRSFKACIAFLTLVFCAPAFAADKPNILIIWGDDIGVYNVGAYNRGAMGYNTPNIDSIANEGILFTDSYGQNSCTAGRSTFITGQSPFRTGLLKVGLPGAKEGISEKERSNHRRTTQTAGLYDSPVWQESPG